MNVMSDEEMLEVQLDELRREHRELDVQISQLQTQFADQIAMRRLKKRKLLLKDQISRLEDQLYPDIIA